MPPDHASDKAAIRCCIRAFAGASTSRGVWQRERALASQLGGRPLDVATARASRRIGEWLRGAASRRAA